MFETLMRLYVMAMANDVRSPTPHLFGPPGSGKSSVCAELARMIGVKLYVINVSRISPLELEGVQMPVDNNTQLKLLHATFWTQLQEGDIVLFDEFLRGFPEVYNGLLDILTSREVGGYVLPKVFVVAASNSTVAYDKALEDRLLHLPVPDPRKNKRIKMDLAQRVVDELGLLPDMVNSSEMLSLLDTEVLPMFEVLDALKNRASTPPAMMHGSSIRNLIGQAKLRQIVSPPLQEVIDFNNRRAMSAGKVQFVFLTSGSSADPKYRAQAEKLVGNPNLTKIQALNLDLNLQLLDLEALRTHKETQEEPDDDIFE